MGSCWRPFFQGERALGRVIKWEQKDGSWGWSGVRAVSVVLVERPRRLLEITAKALMSFVSVTGSRIQDGRGKGDIGLSR